MSISSHLTPEPERRLWIIHDAMRRSVEWTELKLAGLTVFLACEAAFLRLAGPPRALGAATTAAMAAALPLGAFALWPRTALAPEKERPVTGENLLEAGAIARYSFAEAVNRLDRYLGGGITATQYHEDLVARLVVEARVATRKQRLLRAQIALAVLAQLGLAACLLSAWT